MTRVLRRGTCAAIVTMLWLAMATSASAYPGQIVTTFGPDGNGTLLAPATIAVLAQSDGKVLTVGTVDNTLVVTRRSTSGHLDPTFGTNGTARIPISGRNIGVPAAALQTDGKLL